MNKLSIVIPTFNRKQFLRTTLLSVFTDRIKSVEVIVVDDGSTDGTEDSLSEFPVTYIKTIKREGNGPASARNVGLKRATGEFITFLDSDDTVAQGGLSSRLHWLIQNPEFESVGGQIASYIDATGRPLSLPSPLNLPALIDLNFFRRGGRAPLTLWPYLFRRNLIERAGFLDEKLRVADDCEYLFRILSLSPIPVINHGCLNYRIHDRNWSRNERGKLKNIAAAENYLVRRQYDIPLPTVKSSKPNAP